jgi:hypothetical protein
MMGLVIVLVYEKATVLKVDTRFHKFTSSVQISYDRVPRAENGSTGPSVGYPAVTEVGDNSIESVPDEQRRPSNESVILLPGNWES